MDFKNAINKKKDSDDASSDELPPPTYDPPYVPMMHGRSYANFMILPEDLPGNISDGKEWIEEYYDEIREHFGTLVNVLRVHFPGRKIRLDKKGRLYRDFFQLTYHTSSR